MLNKRKILVIHNNLTRFVALDVQILKERYPVSTCYCKTRWINPLVAWKSVNANDLVLGWFASWHTFLPFFFARVQRKPALLVTGGYDVANNKAIGYGHQRGGLKKWVSCKIIKWASKVIAFSHASEKEIIEHVHFDYSRLSTIYLGVPDILNHQNLTQKKKMVMTVGNVDRSNLLRKGHEPFVRTAAYLPDVKFVLIGNWKDDAINYLRSISSPNVDFTGWVDLETLNEYYKQASVYVQVSAHEGFGLSVAEAMLAGCVPVVTGRGSLPEVVGDCGLYVENQDPQEIARAVEKALQASNELRIRARERILREFPMSKRAEALYDLMDQMA